MVVRVGGLWALLTHARLALRLMRDDRVPLAAKLVLPATVLYLVSPVDLVPDLVPLLGQVDDVGVLILGLVAFVKLCPRHLVAEHEARFGGRAPTGSGRAGPDEPIDARYRWADGRGRPSSQATR